MKLMRFELGELSAMTVLMLLAVSASPKPRIGLKMGASSITAQSSVSGRQEQSSIWAPTCGLSLRYHIAPTLEFQSELLLAISDTRCRFNGKNEDGSASTTLVGITNYLQIPFLLRIAPKTSRTIKPSFAIGPTLTSLMQIGGKPSWGMLIGSFSHISSPVTISTLDAGVIFGGGFDIRVGKGIITTDLRYILRAFSISQNSNSVNAVRIISLLVGYYF
jgi:hypothetical protein